MLIKRYKIQPNDHALYDEFMQNPFGPHSLALQKILNAFRGCGELRYALLVTKPHQEWTLVTPQAPGVALDLHPQVFTNLADAEREIFRRRWQYYSEIPC